MKTITYHSNAQLLISKSALLENISTYRSKLNSRTKILLMIKANGYGTDNLLVAKEVDNKVDYFGVAFPQNGYGLKAQNISTPILVMASTPNDLNKMCQEKLEPVLYSLDMVKAAVSLNLPLNVHLEIDAGMKRLGLLHNELSEVIELLNGSNLQIKSVFAHVAAPGDPSHDDFTHQQAAYFNTCFKQLYANLVSKPFKHLMPTGGVTRFSQYQYDMIRLGIGIYGYDSADLLNKELKTVATFQCHILQIVSLKKGESIGYNRIGKLHKEGKIATLSVGYADGYSRAFSNGKGEVLINGKRAKIVGLVCMDLVMVDVSDIPCKVGDIVELFGDHVTIAELAKKTNTIPYEILTNISSRVERVVVD